MARKTFTEILGEKRYDQLLDERTYVYCLLEAIEAGDQKEWWPYTKWLALYRQAIDAALILSWPRVAMLGALANCERYPEHLHTTLL